MTEKKEKQMEQLFRANYERMYRLAFALLHDNEEARDVVSDVFSKLWEHDVKEETASSYLMQSVKNACLNLIAQKKRDERLQQLLPLEEEQDTQLEERWQATVHCIDHDLTPQTASVIRLCFGEQMSYKETAEELGISISAVNKHIVKGLRTLRDKLKDL